MNFSLLELHQKVRPFRNVIKLEILCQKHITLFKRLNLVWKSSIILSFNRTLKAKFKPESSSEHIVCNLSFEGNSVSSTYMVHLNLSSWVFEQNIIPALLIFLSEPTTVKGIDGQWLLNESKGWVYCNKIDRVSLIFKFLSCKSCNCFSLHVTIFVPILVKTDNTINGIYELFQLFCFCHFFQWSFTFCTKGTYLNSTNINVIP